MCYLAWQYYRKPYFTSGQLNIYRITNGYRGRRVSRTYTTCRELNLVDVVQEQGRLRAPPRRREGRQDGAPGGNPPHTTNKPKGSMRPASGGRAQARGQVNPERFDLPCVGPGPTTSEDISRTSRKTRKTMTAPRNESSVALRREDDSSHTRCSRCLPASGQAGHRLGGCQVAWGARELRRRRPSGDVVG